MSCIHIRLCILHIAIFANTSRFFNFHTGNVKKSKLAVLETLYDTVQYLNWKSSWDCFELYRTLLQQSLAVDVLRPV